MTRLLIADDHKMMREGLTELLAEIPGATVVGSAADGAETLSKVNALAPDILILDLSMPVFDGFEVMKHLKAREIPVKVIVLSMHREARAVRKALAAGADGYVLKEEAFDTLALGIETVRKGRRYLSPAVREVMGRESTETAGELTPREVEVIAMIASGKGSKEIAADLGISLKTVENHRQNIMMKLGVHKATEIVRYALEKGIM